MVRYQFFLTIFLKNTDTSKRADKIFSQKLFPFHEIKEENGEDTDSINRVKEEMNIELLPSGLD